METSKVRARSGKVAVSTSFVTEDGGVHTGTVMLSAEDARALAAKLLKAAEKL